MKKNKDNNLNIRINKVYTKNGDTGKTYLVGGHLVSKDSIRVEGYGAVDELNSYLGSCISLISNDFIQNKSLLKLSDLLKHYQHELFNLGNMLATLPEDYHENMPKINSKSVENMEKNIDYYNNKLKSLDSFVLPGGHELCVRFHLCRVVCRRTERLVVKLNKIEEIDIVTISFLNRFSDFLFVVSRWANDLLEVDEVTWNPKHNI